MALYLIGDLQGCDAPLQRLLQKIDFSPSRDTLYLLGDLVNRGPDSAAVLRRLMGYGASAQCVLGNHDLHLLAVHYGVRRPSRKDTLDNILQASDRHAMLEWLRHQNMALHARWGGRDVLMVHAGVLPQWTWQRTMALAREVQDVLRSPDAADFFAQMYGNIPCAWDEGLVGMERLRVVVNALTRLRFCTANGTMEFESKDGAAAAPTGFSPWFEVRTRKTADITVAFGHWSTLGWLHHPTLWSLDTGCVWGGCLSALRVEPPAHRVGLGNTLPLAGIPLATELIQVECEQAQKPGE